MNLPNKLTVSRIFMAIAFLLLAVPLPISIPDDVDMFSWAANLLNLHRNFIHGSGRYLAGIVFLIAFATDAADGFIARK